MMTKTITAVVMVVGLVAASAGAVHAGSGGGGLPSGGGALLECYFINYGVKPGVVLNLNDQFTNPTQYKLGAATLLCTPADASLISGSIVGFGALIGSGRELPEGDTLDDAD